MSYRPPRPARAWTRVFGKHAGLRPISAGMVAAACRPGKRRRGARVSLRDDARSPSIERSGHQGPPRPHFTPDGDPRPHGGALFPRPVHRDLPLPRVVWLHGSILDRSLRGQGLPLGRVLLLPQRLHPLLRVWPATRGALRPARRGSFSGRAYLADLSIAVGYSPRRGFP